YIPRIVAAYAVTRSEAAADTPATLFFGPDAVFADSAYVLRPFEGNVPSEAELEALLYEQVESQRTMSRTRANARVNRGVRTHWFEIGDYVTKRPHPLPTNLAAMFTRRRGPYRVIGRYGPTYHLSYVDGTPFESGVPGNELMLYLFDADTDPDNVSPHPSDNDDDDDDSYFGHTDGVDMPVVPSVISIGSGSGSSSSSSSSDDGNGNNTAITKHITIVDSPPESFADYIDEGNRMFLANEPDQNDARVEALQEADDSSFAPDETDETESSLHSVPIEPTVTDDNDNDNEEVVVISDDGDDIIAIEDTAEAPIVDNTDNAIVIDDSEHSSIREVEFMDTSSSELEVPELLRPLQHSDRDMD
ncbi:hypothetical protein GGI24_006526, partial [Coemansia furcata]